MAGNDAKRSVTVALVAMAASPIILHRRGAAIAAQTLPPAPPPATDGHDGCGDIAPASRAVARGGFGMLGDVILPDDAAP